MAKKLITSEGYIHPSAEELDHLQITAGKGDLEAHYQLGRYYTLHEEVQNFRRARYHYKYAADRGHAGAQNNLGATYMDNPNFADLFSGSQYKKAAALFQQAADQGFTVAEYNLAGLYEDGTGVPHSYEKAAELYQKAADKGYARAQYSLAILYLQGLGVEQNDEMAAALFMLAAEQEFAEAQAELIDMYSLLTKNTVKSLRDNFGDAVERRDRTQQQELTNRIFIFLQNLAAEQSSTQELINTPAEA